MRILQLLHSRNFAGTEQLALTLSLALKKAGHEVVVAVKDGGVLAQRYKAAGLQVADLPLNAFFLRGRLARWVRANGIDVVHAHLTEATRIANKLRRDTGVAAVAHLHVMRKARAYEEMAANGFLIAISEHTAKYYREEARLPANRIRTIINATDAINAPEAHVASAPLAEAFRKELGLPADARLLAFPGRIAPEKGHEMVFRAMPAVLKAFPKAHVLVAGNLEQKKSYASRLRTLRAQLGLENNVHFLGSRADVLKLTRASELQLVPSEREPFGLVVVEAMAMSTPVIGANSGAIPEILEGGRLGTLVPYGDTRALTEAVCGVLSDARPYVEKAALAKQVVAERYAPGRMAVETISVYNEALALNSKSKTNHQ